MEKYDKFWKEEHKKQVKYYKKLGEINVKIFSFTEWKKQKNDNKGFYEDVISTGINLIGEMPLV